MLFRVVNPSLGSVLFCLFSKFPNRPLPTFLQRAVKYALGSVSTIHKACFSRLMQQLIQFKRWSSMSVRSDRNASFYFVLISCNEVKLPNLFVLALGPYPVDQQKS
jgi:hypothetical protein